MTNLRFADDVLLFASTLSELKSMIADLSLEAHQYGLQLHPDKTKILSNEKRRQGAETHQHTNILQHSIQIMPFEGATKYLGRMFSFHQSQAKDIDNRGKAVWNKFHANKHILCNNAYQLKQSSSCSTRLSHPPCYTEQADGH